MITISKEDWKYDNEDDSERATGIVNEGVTEALAYIIAHRHEHRMLVELQHNYRDDKNNLWVKHIEISSHDRGYYVKEYSVLGYGCDSYSNPLSPTITTPFRDIFDTVVDGDRVLAFEKGNDPYRIYYIPGTYFDNPSHLMFG